MEAIYAECKVLRAKFVTEERDKMPDYMFTREDGEKFLRTEAYDALERRADAYYQKCLDERSIRLPRTDFQQPQIKLL